MSRVSQGIKMMRYRAMAVGLLLISSTVAAQVAEFIGPNPIDNAGDLFTGRVSALATSPTNASLFYAAGADGGVWRSTDAGATWEALTDDMPTTAIGSLAIDPANEQVIYAGTGEPNYANHSRYGLGIYKSTNGGNTWVQLAENVFAGRTISSIVVSHEDSDVVYASVARAGGFPGSVELAAAKGHPQAEGDLGVYRSVDGGVNWTLLPNLPDLAVTDLIMHPTDADILFAGVGRIFGNVDNGIYRSIDGGSNWTKLTTGLPADIGRISLTISPTMTDRLYTLLTNPSNVGATTLGVYRSDDGGDNWIFLANSVAANPFDPGDAVSQAFFGWYISLIEVDPADPDRVYAGGFNLARSDDAGVNWLDISPPHVDQHALTWSSDGTLLSGSDGGVFSSTDMGASWSPLNNGLDVVQFYAGLSLDPTDAEIVIGGTQDNGTNLRTDGGAWAHVLGGDGGWTQLDPVDPQTRYAQSQGVGNVFRINPDNSIDALNDPMNPQLFGRTAFFAPFLVDPTNRDRLLYATNFIFESLDRGANWTMISGDVTAGIGGVRTIAMAPSDTDVIYIATNDGLVQRSDDGGENFTMIAENNPGWPRITRELFVHPDNAMIVYRVVAFFDSVQILRSNDGGANWQALDGAFPDIPVNSVAVDTRAEDLLDGVIYVGTDAGIYVSIDDGASWQLFGIGMPNTAVIDLIIDEPRSRLVAATQGRGAWSLPASLPAELEVVVQGNGTVTSSPGGINCPGDCNEVYFNSGTITLTATPGPGQQFLNWAGDCSGAVCEITPDQAQRVIAIFAGPDVLFIDSYE